MTQLPDSLIYQCDTATEAEIAAHLVACDFSFVPPLHTRVTIADYASKLFHRARRHEAWVGSELTGVVAAYTDGPEVFISNVSVLPGWMGRGIAQHLLSRCLEDARQQQKPVALAVAEANGPARALYARMGFITESGAGDVLRLVFKTCMNESP